MTDSPFDSAWLKWGRAVVHADSYEREIERVRKQPDLYSFSASVAAEYDAKRHGFVMTIAEIDAMPPIFTLILGDIVHDYRCALDHVAWAMYQRGNRAGQLTTQQERNIHFPILQDPATVDAQIRGIIQGIRPTDLAKVRRRQPCRNAARNRPFHCFTVLQQFSNDDKHREVNTLFSLPTSGAVQVPESRDCVIPEMRRRGPVVPLEVGAEIGVLHARKTGPEPHADVKVTIVAQPAIRPRLTVITWMDKTRKFTAGLLRALAPAPRDALIEIGVAANVIP